jgi:deazaflavin-dependent oxidoreductase (nitroreductase family)
VTATSPDGRKRRRVVALQRWLLNPPMKILVWLGVVPGHIVIETRGRRTGRARRTVVGAHHDGEAIWAVAEQGRHAAWVRNLDADPAVRVRHRARWRPATASVIDDDDPTARLATWNRPGHARLVHRFGTQLTTVRLDLREPQGSTTRP